MTATIDSYITNQDVAALFQRNSLVTGSNAATLQITAFFRVFLCQPLAVYAPATGYGNILLSNGIDKTIMEISVPSILICRSNPLFRFVICLHRRRSRQNGCARCDMELHIAFQSYASAKICTRGQHHPTTAISNAFLNGCINGNMVKSLAIAFSSKILHIVIDCRKQMQCDKTIQ